MHGLELTLIHLQFLALKLRSDIARTLLMEDPMLARTRYAQMRWLRGWLTTGGADHVLQDFVVYPILGHSVLLPTDLEVGVLRQLHCWFGRLCWFGHGKDGRHSVQLVVRSERDGFQGSTESEAGLQVSR